MITNNLKPIARLAWIPIPVFLIAVIGLGFVNQNIEKEPENLFNTLSFIFTVLGSLITVHLISRGFRVRGKLWLFFLGSGVIFWGFSGLAGIFFDSIEVNIPFSVHNICMGMSAICNLSGAVLLTRQTRSIRAADLWLTIGYSVAIVIVAFIAKPVIEQSLPGLFMKGQGESMFRYAIISGSILMFSITALILNKYNKKSYSPFNYWYSMALVLITVSLYSSIARKDPGSILIWTGWTAQYLGEVYMVIAGISLVRETGIWKISIEESLHEREQQLKYYFENSTLAVIEWQSDFIVTQWSGEAERIFGWNKDEVLGKRIDALNIIYEEDIPLVQRTMTRLSGGQEVKVVSSNRNNTKNGDIIECVWYNTVLKDDNGNMSSVMSLVEDVTRLRKTERELIESKERYKELVTNARSLIINLDEKGRIVFVNEFAQTFFGYSDEELIGKPATETIIPQIESTGRDLNKLVENIYEDPDKYSLNINENIKKNGDRVWIEWHNKALFDKNGKRSGHIAIGTDITEMKKTEEALRKSETTLWSVLNATQESIYMFDRDGKISLSNLTGYKRLEISAEKDLIGHNFSEFMNIKEADRRQARLDEVFKTGMPLQFEDERDGIYFRHNFFPVFKDSEVTNVVTYSTDITGNKNAEIKLQEAREKLNMALENGNIGIWEWNLVDDHLIMDERMEKMFDLEPGTFDNTFKSFENLVHDEDILHLQKAINNTLDKGFPFETIFRTKTEKGKPKYISTKAIVNKDAEGKPVSFAGVSFDVTGMREGTEQLMMALNEELLRSNKELEQFAYVASHDLQEPLRMVSSFTQLLSVKYKDKLDNDGREYIQYAVEGANRMYELINGLLSYSRIQTRGKGFVTVNMNSVLEQACNDLKFKLQQSKIQLVTEDLPFITADATQMVQLMQNLISNAIKFSPESSKIFISCRAEKAQFVFSVRDEGIGIEPVYYEKIFLIFQRLFPKGEYEGTGIGLAICKRIVERHGGRIWVESEYGKGSTFFFTIPREARK